MEEQLSSSDTLILVHRDAAGNPKPIFQENKFFLFLIKHGLLSPRAWKIPYLLGRWQTYKEIKVNGNH